ncbi:MAG TPA: hypothetical protein VK835_02315 [Bacteroidia bacterium]|jgi:hypothetical protein|nr:hypothetical protein [Bacteroidia bacterium]
MYRKDYLEREFEKLSLIIAYILNLKKENKPFSEIELAAKTGLRSLFGEDFDLETVEHDTDVNEFTPQKQQALADILFELGVTGHQQNKPKAAKRFLSQYLYMLTLIEKNSLTFSFQNLSNKAIADEIMLSA